MRQSMLSTSDNPFDPFDEYDDWLSFDSRHGYHTPEYLAGVVVTSDELSDHVQHEHIEEAIDKIVLENINGLYIKVVREIDEETFEVDTKV